MLGCPQCGRRFEGDETVCPEDGAVLVAVSTVFEVDPLIGATLDGRYLIQRKLGEGGMGIVYLATHVVIEKKCAVKVLRSDVSGEPGIAARFIQEARSAAAIPNEHVIEINDFGQTPEGNAYFVMEYLNGRSLQDILSEQPVLKIERALHIGAQCCEALAAAHAAGVVHRDLKPENLILVNRGGTPDFVKVLDFGIAKVARETDRLTKTGTIFGTPQYMAPEQAAGTAMDERVDIYSLGVILYECLCGRVPFEADTFMGVLTKHLYEAPIPPSAIREKGFSKAVESVILKAMAKKPERRFLSMVQMGDDIRAVLSGEMPTAAMDDLEQSTLPPSPSEVVGAIPSRASGVSRRSSRVKQWLIGVTLVVLAAFASAAYMLTRKDDTDTATVPRQSSAGVANAAVELSPTPSARIDLDSRPSGAALYKGDEHLGNLPVSIDRPSESSTGDTYRLSLNGYRDLDVLVTRAMPDKMVVDLMATENTTEKVVKTSEKKAHRSKKRPKKRFKSTKKKRSTRLSGDIMDPWK